MSPPPLCYLLRLDEAFWSDRLTWVDETRRPMRGVICVASLRRWRPYQNEVASLSTAINKSSLIWPFCKIFVGAQDIKRTRLKALVPHTLLYKVDRQRMIVIARV